MEKKIWENKIKEIEELLDKADLEDLEYIRKILEAYKDFYRELQGKRQTAIPLPWEEDEVVTYAFDGLEKLHPSV